MLADFWDAAIAGPILEMIEFPAFFFEVVFGGLMAGVMYSLVALGFVLIFKASGVFNFAQGIFALFAALTLVGLMTGTIPVIGAQIGWLAMPAWLAVIVTIFVMIGLAYLVERFILRRLVNQDPIILFMSTIGLAFILEGTGDILWGARSSGSTSASPPAASSGRRSNSRSSTSGPPPLPRSW